MIVYDHTEPFTRQYPIKSKMTKRERISLIVLIALMSLIAAYAVSIIIAIIQSAEQLAGLFK